MKGGQRKPSLDYLSGTWVPAGVCMDCRSIGEYSNGMCSSCGGRLTKSIDHRWIPPKTKKVWRLSCAFPFIIRKVIITREGEWTVHPRHIK